MKLITWEPLNEVESLFDDRFMQPFSLLPKIGLDLAIDVYQEKGNLIAKMNLPGIDSKEINIKILDDVLTVSGKRDEEKEISKKDYYSKEIKRGSFSRTVSLPKTVDASKAEAKYDNGELIISMPEVVGAKEKGILIPIKE